MGWPRFSRAVHYPVKRHKGLEHSETIHEKTDPNNGLGSQHYPTLAARRTNPLEIEAETIEVYLHLSGKRPRQKYDCAH